jgi:hypothetical protein
MKLPQFFRKVMWISIWVFVGVGVLLFLAAIIGAIFHITLPENVGDTLLNGVVILWMASFTSMMVSMAAAPLLRFLENAGLRSLGESGIGRIMDFHTVTEGRTKFGPQIAAVRFKVKVRTPQGETFDSIAELSPSEYFRGNKNGALEVGREVPVKYHLPTKEVALVVPKKQPKPKKPNW